MKSWLLLASLAVLPFYGEEQTCPTNHYLTGNMCVACNAAMKWCISCTGMGACTNCAPGAYLSGGYCKPCDHTCERCTGPGACTACSSSHCRASDGTCKEPGEIYTGCSKCAHDTGKCIICADGYVHSGLGSTPCTKCPDNCLSCKSSSECIKPSSGYYIDSSTRMPVACKSDNCDVCTSAEVCTICKPGYKLSTSATCTACTDSNCSVCDTDKCTACKPGYALNSNGSCQACESGCAICADNERQLPDKCLPNECQHGYYYYPYIDSCVECPQDCVNCYFEESHQVPVCTRCKDSTSINVGPNIYGIWCSSPSTVDCTNRGFLENGLCIHCYAQIVGCIACDDRFHCTECLDGFYLYNNVCVYCDDNCLTCETSATNCTDCDDGFVLQNNKCVKVGSVLSNCIQAKSTTNPTDGCSICKGGFYIHNNECKKCVDNCQICTGSSMSDCKVGFNGYRYNNTTNMLEKCNGNNCEMCVSSVDSCSVCKEGFYLSSDGRNCIKGEVPNCKIYLSSGSSCSECLANYGVSSDGRQCSPCLEGCKGECTESACESGECIQGYYFNNEEKCIQCPYGCASCVMNSENQLICDRCSSGEVFAISSIIGLSCNKINPKFSRRVSTIITVISFLGIIVVAFMVITPFLVHLAKKRGMMHSRIGIKHHGSESHNEMLLEEQELL